MTKITQEKRIFGFQLESPVYYGGEAMVTLGMSQDTACDEFQGSD